MPVCIFWSTPEIDDDGRLLEDERLLCEVAGEPADAHGQWTYVAGHPITKAEYDFLMADLAHARQWRPNSPEANPRKPIDLNQLPPLFGPGGPRA